MEGKITVGSMFAGIGGICLAFKQNGFKIIWANEIDKHACKTYRLNFGDEYLTEGDIQKIDTKDIPKFDVLTAGFPESFILPKENEKQVYKQIGNSVCVPVVDRIVKNILRSLV